MSRRVAGGVAAKLLAVAILYFVYALQYQMGPLAKPGPGFLPAVLAAGLAASSLVVLFQTLRSSESRDGPAEMEGEASEEATFRPWRPAAIVGALVGFVAILQAVGFLPALWGLFIVTSKAMHIRGWARTVITATVLIVAVHFVFERWLMVPLPQGQLISYL